MSKTVLIRRCAALRLGSVTSVAAACKHALRAIARRWLPWTRRSAVTRSSSGRSQATSCPSSSSVPELVEAFGIGPDIASELLIVAGDNPERVRSEAAFAKLSGTSPIPASSGKTTRHRLNRGGHRHANAALYRAVIVRLQYHEPTKAYLERRTAEGKTKPEIIRCLKRYLAREVWALMRPLRERRQALPGAG